MIINGNRALAYIVECGKVSDIEGADRIQLAEVGGWKVIIKKGELREGDKGVFFEIDSKLPEAEWSEFLRDKHFKVKTMKLGKFGVISQGLLLPLTVFPELAAKEVGADVTDILGVKYSVQEDNYRKGKAKDTDAKYKSMASRHQKIFRLPFVRKMMKTKAGKRILFFLFGRKKDKPLKFPTHFPFVHRTDEERCENMPWVLGYERPLVVTEKLDGCLDRDVAVVTDNGCIKISQIVNHHLPVNVLTYNENLGICEYRPIKEYHRWKRVSDMYDVVVSQRGYKQGNRDKHIRCTSEHSFYVGNGKYIKAKDLKITDTIYHRSQIIDPMAKEILLGMLLGDASLGSKHGDYNGSVDINHSVVQKEYFNEIVRLLGNNLSTSTATSGYGSELLRAHFYTNAEFKELVNRICLDENGKHVTEEWANELTPVSLAFWYMDDGTISNADSDNVRPRISIATNGFSYDECQILQSALKTKFNISADIKTRDSYKGNVLTLDTENTQKFTALIAPYVCDAMKYKLPKIHRNIQYCLGDYVVSNGSSIVPTNIISISKIEDYNNNFVFDLTVEGNHNYFANGILTHNTSSTYILEHKGRKKYEFYVLSRNVRQQTPDQKCYHDKNIYWDMALKYNVEQHLKDYLLENKDLKYVCVQGESVGSVQGNPLKLKEDDLYVFNFIRSDVGRLPSTEGKEIVESWGMKWVPILDTDYHVPEDMEEFKQYATAKSVVNPDVLREGVVLRDPTNDLSFKNVSREYLLKHGG